MSILAAENREIANGLLLIKEPLGTAAYEFYLLVSLLQSLEVTIDFSASENIYLEGTSSLITKSLVHPFSKTKIATVKLLDEWKIVSKFRCKIVDPPKALILEAMKKEKNEIKLKLENCKDALLRVPVSLTPLSELEKILKNSSLVFIDSEFPPLDFLEKVKFAWKRISNVYPNVQLLPEYIEPFDLIQGDGKDFWVKSAFEVLAERPECIKRLFITKQSNNLGIYRVKLCKNNAWTFVTVDDYIPFLPNSSCLLSTTIDKTSWATILEKAYCKLLGSYEIINYNMINEILMDFTGCPCLLYSISESEIQKAWEIINENSDQGYICCLFSEDNEKVPVTYIIQTFILDERGLLQCRNLTEEQKVTRWSKNSKLWTSKYKAKVNPLFDLNSFYLEIDEAAQMFNKLVICKLANWHEFRHKAEFCRQEAHFCKSSVYYSITLEESTHLVISLQQEHELEPGVSHCRSYIDAGLMIFQYDEENQFTIVKLKDLVIERTIVVELDLEPGSYIILPYTSGCLLQSPQEISPEKMKLFHGSSPNIFFTSALNDIFAKLDKNDEKVLKFDKFKHIHDKLGKTINEGEFRQKILKKYLAVDDGVTLEGFRNFIYDQAKSGPEEIIWEWLESNGYDRDFYSVSTRLFFIAFHSDKEITTEIRKNSCDFEDLIFKYLISTQGVDFESNGAVKVKYYFSKDVHCYFYGIANLKEEGIECTIDCSESENMIFYFKDARASRYVGSGEIEYVMPALALPAAENFSKSVRIFY